jgi:type I restriction enzyme M protein
LVDCYRVYQLLSNKWQTIVNDIETIQTEGLDAVRTVEPATKLVKDGDEEKEVPDGMKGRILPFELVQENSEVLWKYKNAVKSKENRQEAIAGEIEELIGSFTEDEAQEYMDEADTPKPEKTKIKKDAKAKGDDIEPETKEKLKKLVALWDEQSKLNKALKEARQTLTDKTIEYIQGLSDDDAKMWISDKWITPVMGGIVDTPDDICEELEKAVDAMSQKYATSYHDLNAQLTEAQDELSGLISQLEGDESSIAGLNALMNSFKD